MIEGTAFTFFVPFRGELTLFQCQGNSYSSNQPSADIRGNELVFRYESVGQDATEIKARFERDLANVKQNLG